MKSPREEKVKELLRRLGAAPNYTGFHYLVEAVLLCTEEESKLLSVTKTLYPETARHFSVSSFCHRAGYPYCYQNHLAAESVSA